MFSLSNADRFTTLHAFGETPVAAGNEFSQKTVQHVTQIKIK